MRETYEVPCAEVIEFAEEDIIVTSGAVIPGIPDNGDGDGGWTEEQ